MHTKLYLTVIKKINACIHCMLTA